MLVKGQIPTDEPIVSIGLILPEDVQTSVIIKDDDALEENKILHIKAENKQLLINEIPKEKIFITKSPLTLNPISAGRGFHWEKQISIKVEGTIEIKNQDGFLFVINHISLEKYLASVAVSEMSSKCPDTFLQAQTITARSWILAAAENKHSDLGIDARAQGDALDEQRP
ncbi:MAG: SpoIID/LytB domain-containing protein [Bacteroidetes bacterium]|nr:SpoIID/LytB domain-containing protein [Bacteroidota bacterium]